MAAKVVDDDNVAGPQLGDLCLVDVGLEGHAVDRTVEHHRRNHAGNAQGADEGGGLPVAVQHRRAQARTAQGSAVRAHHLRRGPGLIDKDQAVGVEIWLAFEPGPALLQDVRAVVLGGVRGLFCA